MDKQCTVLGPCSMHRHEFKAKNTMHENHKTTDVSSAVLGCVQANISILRAKHAPSVRDAALVSGTLGRSLKLWHQPRWRLTCVTCAYNILSEAPSSPVRKGTIAGREAPMSELLVRSRHQRGARFYLYRCTVRFACRRKSSNAKMPICTCTCAQRVQ